MLKAPRLLGFAFASADFLFEVDEEARVLFATGAFSTPGGTEALIGHPGMDIFCDGEAPRFRILASGLRCGERAGPFPMTLKNGAKANLSLCHLPQNQGRISCVLTYPGGRTSLGAGGTDTETGLADRNAFVNAAAISAGTNAGLALVNLANLPALCAKLTKAESEALLARIGDTIRAMGASAAGRVSETGFGVVTDDPREARSLAGRIQRAVRGKGIDRLETEEILVSLKGRDLTPEQTMLAMRHVIGRFAESALGPEHPRDLAQAFDAMINETVSRVQQFNATVSDGDFALAYEPIVSLNTGNIAHYEALTRFKPGQSPADTIRFAEEMGISEGFDLAVAVKIFATLESDKDAPALAMNISGRTLSSSSSFALLAGLLIRKRALAKRVLIEITETSEITDLQAADRAVQVVREMGYRIGIDDFGSGAASLQYLHGLNVDFVKLDGLLIQRIGKSTREDALLRGVINTCRDLGIETIAEWIDSDEKHQACKEMGVDLGQGRHFGKTLTVLPAAEPVPQKRARRMGTQESWG